MKHRELYCEVASVEKERDVVKGESLGM